MATRAHEEAPGHQGHSEELVQLAHKDRMGARDQLGGRATTDTQGQQVTMAIFLWSDIWVLMFVKMTYRISQFFLASESFISKCLNARK